MGNICSCNDKNQTTDFYIIRHTRVPKIRTQFHNTQKFIQVPDDIVELSIEDSDD